MFKYLGHELPYCNDITPGTFNCAYHKQWLRFRLNQRSIFADIVSMRLIFRHTATRLAAECRFARFTAFRFFLALTTASPVTNDTN